MLKTPLKKSLGIKSIILMMLTSSLSIKWIPFAGGLGPFALVLWVIAALVFFIPLALIIIELSINYPQDSGIYLWISEGLGKKAGFYAAWYYWINCVFYYPGILTFIAVNLAYLIDRPELATNTHYIVGVVLICFWGAVFYNIAGIHLLARLTNLSGLFNFRLALFVILSGIYYLVINGSTATDFSPQHFLPGKDFIQNLSSLAILMFALAGLEIIPSLAHSIDDPERNLAKGIIISGVILVLLYILGTLAINVILNPHELSKTTGLLDAFYSLCHKLHLSPWIAKFLILSLIIVEFGGLSLWLIAPSIMFFHGAEKGVLPNWLQRLNHNYIPANALLVQGVMVTIVILLTRYLPTANDMYTVLLLMSTIIYFLPYLFLAVSHWRLRHNKVLKKHIMPNYLAKLAVILTFSSVTIGIATAFIPTKNLYLTHSVLKYELELSLGPLLFIGLGILIYQRRTKNNN